MQYHQTVVQRQLDFGDVKNVVEIKRVSVMPSTTTFYR